MAIRQIFFFIFHCLSKSINTNNELDLNILTWLGNFCISMLRTLIQRAAILEEDEKKCNFIFFRIVWTGLGWKANGFVFFEDLYDSKITCAMSIKAPVETNRDRCRIYLLWRSGIEISILIRPNYVEIYNILMAE